MNSIRIQNSEVMVTGRLIKTARLEEEWYEDVENPEIFIELLKNSSLNADIFTFWQRLPETTPKYHYYMEWEDVAAMQIKSFDSWWQTQIKSRTRGLIRKAKKNGIVLKEATFDDHFVQGMVNIFNETPMRQGKPFLHYGKDFSTVKKQFSRYLDREDLIGAYYNGELIGFIFLAYAVKYALTAQILSKVEHRDKATNNALIAKAVELCDKRGVPYLLYFYWGTGHFSEFKRRCGFQKVPVPRYYVPLTLKGKIVLKLNLHHGLSGILPESLLVLLKNLRKKLYTTKYS